MQKTSRSIAVAVFFLSIMLLISCKTIKFIPENLKFNPKRHSHIRTMTLHMLFIDRVNGKKLKYSRTKRIYDVKTYAGMKTIDVIYSGGTGWVNRQNLRPGRYRIWVYKKQKKIIRFRALPGRCHFIQYIAHPKGPMTVWQESHDYISHLRKKPVYKRDLSKNRTMKVSRTVRGSLPYIKKRFLNELMLQEYLGTFISSWSITLMFQPKGNIITVNRPGIGEDRLDNWVTGRFKFQSAGRNSTRITMYVKQNFHAKFPNFMKQVFARFDPSYRVNTLK